LAVTDRSPWGALPAYDARPTLLCSRARSTCAAPCRGGRKDQRRQRLASNVCLPMPIRPPHGPLPAMAPLLTGHCLHDPSTVAHKCVIITTPPPPHTHPHTVRYASVTADKESASCVAWGKAQENDGRAGELPAQRVTVTAGGGKNRGAHPGRREGRGRQGRGKAHGPARQRHGLRACRPGLKAAGRNPRQQEGGCGAGSACKAHSQCRAGGGRRCCGAAAGLLRAAAGCCGAAARPQAGRTQ
jgi:hypothetical protein